jgi:hypothetical protein
VSGVVRDTSALMQVGPIHVLVPPGPSPGIATRSFPSRVSFRRLPVLMS